MATDGNSDETFEKWFRLKYPTADAEDFEHVRDIWRNAVSWATDTERRKHTPAPLEPSESAP